MSELAISVSGMGKYYRVGETQGYQTLRESIVTAATAPMRLFRRAAKPAAEKQKGFWALRDVGFDIRKGEVVGVIGRNGAGKSTLLKILSRITDPTLGHADIWGRVGSLLEVGTGFHNELSGRDNIYMSGSMLGMKRSEITRKFDEIVSFAEVGKFIDTPVKRYSSGMYMRLGFAVAAHLEPEILLVDEVLAVGDSAFQKKCMGKMDDVASHGRTILFVSHNMAAIQALCGRTLWMNGGQVAGFGSTHEVVPKYLASSASKAGSLDLRTHVKRYGDGSVRITSVRIEPADGGTVIRTSTPLKVTIEYESDKPVERMRAWAEIQDQATRRPICCIDTQMTGDLPDILPPRGRIVCTTAPTRITPGRCPVDVGMTRNGMLADEIEHAFEFDVEVDESAPAHAATRQWVMVDLQHTWQVET